MILILVAFLFEWRTALISLIAIPLSLMAALLVLYLRGDDDQHDDPGGAGDRRRRGRRRRDHRRREHLAAPAPARRRDRQARRRAIILEASLEVRSAIVYATLINVLAVVPVFFLQSVTGSFFQPLAFSYALAILVSMVVALTVTPALGLILLSKTRAAPRCPARAMAQARLRGERCRGSSAGRGRRSPPSACSRSSACVVVPGLGHELYPEFKEQDFFDGLGRPRPARRLRRRARIMTRFSHDIAAIPGVRSFGSHIGQAFLAEEVVGSNFGESWFSIDRNADYDKTVDALEETVDGYPGIYRDV